MDIENLKYGRTPHLLFSETVTDDDKRLKDHNNFVGRDVVASIKMDGECSGITFTGKSHARSVDSKHHESRNHLKEFAASIKGSMPSDYKIFGENMYARHSIEYNELDSLFYGFAMYKGQTCLSWEETLDWFALLDITPVPVIYSGIWDESLVKELFKSVVSNGHEGIVVRLSNAFEYHDMGVSIAKAVRFNHVQTSKHWMHQQCIRNKVKKVVV